MARHAGLQEGRRSLVGPSQVPGDDADASLASLAVSSDEEETCWPEI
jgi:hypothetical protein